MPFRYADANAKLLGQFDSKIKVAVAMARAALGVACPPGSWSNEAVTAARGEEKAATLPIADEIEEESEEELEWVKYHDVRGRLHRAHQELLRADGTPRPACKDKPGELWSGRGFRAARKTFPRASWCLLCAEDLQNRLIVECSSSANSV